MLQSFKTGFRQIGVGLLYGIGFGLTFGLISYFFSQQSISELYQDAALQQVVILKHRDVKEGNQVFILGTLNNQSESTFRSLSVEVDFFDQKGEFIEQYSEYVRGAVQPNDMRNFKVECGCKGRAAPAYASYKVQVHGL